jgi:hypothetical protein
MISWTADVDELLKLSQWISGFDTAFRDPAIFAAAIRRIGHDMQKQFSSEGSSLTRKWQPLAKMTQDTRTERGYNPQHPILQQSGKLRLITADALSSWSAGRVGGTWTDSKGTSMSVSVAGRHMKASLSGPKAQNHWGGNNSDKRQRKNKRGKTAFYVPARPFFGFAANSTDDIANLIINNGMGKWQSIGGRTLVKRTGGMTVLPAERVTGRRGGVEI